MDQVDVKEIRILCQPVVKPQNSSNMDSFELKTALHLISDDETSYYNSLLTKPECKKNLIKFILKSRLSQSAKLRLKDDCTSVEALIRDMQIELLPKKVPLQFKTNCKKHAKMICQLLTMGN
ncbi:hypothetical protein SFRURICE_006288 [Spodoptera frugiperda]|nr:hypothetical protein SFRURICE_006288 [Spodoptera frugiperda]